MRTITRRELNHRSGQIIDQVLGTGEPIEVTTRGQRSVMIVPKPESAWEQWQVAGLIKPADGRLDEAPTATSSRTVAEILEDAGSDH